MLVIDRGTVERLLPMPRAIDVMREALARHHAGAAHQPLRSVVQPPDVDGVIVIKPASIRGVDAALGMKIVTQFTGNTSRAIDAIQGVVLLLDGETGIVVALLDGASITAIRTAAVSAVATDLLARMDATDLAIVGAGVQARSHLEAMAAVRTIRRVRVWNRTTARARALATWAADQLDVAVEIMASADAAVDGADIVCTVTAACEPVLSSSAVAPGTHVNAVGAFQPAARELPSELVRGATVFVDDRAAALAEAGDLLLAADPGSEPVIAAEIGAVVTGAHPGRTSDAEITIFESLGLALEDVAAAAAVVELARREGAGIEIDLT